MFSVLCKDVPKSFFKDCQQFAEKKLFGIMVMIELNGFYFAICVKKVG